MGSVHRSHSFCQQNCEDYKTRWLSHTLRWAVEEHTLVMALSLLHVFVLFLALFANQRKGNCKSLIQLLRSCSAEDGFFRCHSGRFCVIRGLVSDGIQTCPDGSDESVEHLECSDDEVRCRGTQRCIPRWLLNTPFSCQVSETINFPCRPSEFQCLRSRICIPRWMVTDGKKDCNGSLFEDGSDELEGFLECLEAEFRCNQAPNSTTRCIPRDWVMDGHEDCSNGLDEMRPLADCDRLSEVRCYGNGRCIPRYRANDGHPDCSDGSDEESLGQCIENKEFQCEDNGRCIPRSWRVNGLINCEDGSDEIPMSKNESCVEGEFRCHNDKRCIPTSLLCDGMDHCGDCSDEIERCHEPRMFRCPSEPSKCIYWGHSCDTFTDCVNGTDDIKVMHGFKCRRDHGSTERYCAIPQWMLHDDFPNCDDDSDLCLRENSTSTCTTCLDGKTVLASRQICDGIVDCPDFSDECLCSGSFAVERIKKFCQEVSYTNNEENCTIGSLKCGESNRCIERSSVCDGKWDCPSSKLDEVICTTEESQTKRVEVLDFECDRIHEEFLELVPESNLQSFFDTLVPSRAKRCDGITECYNFEDECSARAGCPQRLRICDDLPTVVQVVPPGFLGIESFHLLPVRRCAGVLNFVVGLSICNGVMECDDGIDERNCSEKRFSCDAGTREWPTGTKNVVSIPREKFCDAKLPSDCVDQSDEIDCPEETHFYCENGDPLFVRRSQVLDGRQDCSDFSDECPRDAFSEGGISSREELIRSPVLRILVWVMAAFAISGNALVATVITARFRKRPRKKPSKVAVANDIMILNLAVADFLMGVALLFIAVKSRLFTGRYCLFDKEWRTSLGCSAVGVITVLSSQGSVFTLVALTSYRLYSVVRPIQSKQLRLNLLYVWILVIWLCAFFIAFLPLLAPLANSMVSSAWISSNPFFPTDTVALGPYQEFAKRISALSSIDNGTDIHAPMDWYGIESHLRINFASSSPTVRGYFGYYSESGVCIPRLYLSTVNDKYHNPLILVVMTFNLVALLYIIIAYVVICCLVTTNRVSSSASQKGSNKLQTKIAILVATDLACWFPLCLMTFLNMGRVALPPIVYALSAIVFLPINSSLNPIIYTNPFSHIVKFVGKVFDKVRVVFKAGEPAAEPAPNARL